LLLLLPCFFCLPGRRFFWPSKEGEIGGGSGEVVVDKLLGAARAIDEVLRLVAA